MAVNVFDLPKDKICFTVLGHYSNGQADWGAQGFGAPPAAGAEIIITKRDGGQSRATVERVVEDNTIKNNATGEELRHWKVKLAPKAKRYSRFGRAPRASTNYVRTEPVVVAPSLEPDEVDRLCLASTPVAQVFAR